MVTLYHYTTEDGAKAIMASGKVLPSTGKGDAAFGSGVYLTSMSPFSHGMHSVALNNFDGAWQQNQGKARTAIEFNIPENLVKRVNSKRDVWLYTEGHLSVALYGTKNRYVGKTDEGFRTWYSQ